MIYIVSPLVTVLCFALSGVTLNINTVHRCWLLRAHNSEVHIEGKQISKTRILIISALLMVCAAFTMWRLMIGTQSVINILKLSIALLCLVGSGCVDFIEHRIPNLFPLVMAVGAILLLTLGCLTGQEGAFAYIVSSVFSAAVSAACLTVASLLSRHGIGAGDIKLIAALALMGGVYVICGTLFFAMVACAITSIILLATKKKTIKQSVPFGPFVLIGYMITICMSMF